MNPEFLEKIEQYRKERDAREMEQYGRILDDNERDSIIEKEELQRKKDIENEKIRTIYSEFIRDVPPRFKDATFSSFQCSSDKQRKTVEYLKTGGSAVIYGSNGVGKTHLAYATCEYQARQGKVAGYVLAFDFFNKIRKSFSDGTTEDVMNRYSNYQLLVIDEIDKTQGTQTEFMYLYSLINERYNYMRSTILITNAKPDEFAAIIGQSALDRVASEGKVIDLTGENYRQRKSLHSLEKE
jgi:DNA replication protein DnaC